MIEIITGFIAAKAGAMAGLGVIGLIVSFLLKKFVTAEAMASVGAWFEKAGYYFGKVGTVGLSHWKWTKPIWNNLIEPYIVVLVEQVARFFMGFVKGLQSDNPSTKE